MLVGYVYVDMADRDVGGYVEDLKRVVREKVTLPPGYTIGWSGQYEYMERVRARLGLFIPLTIAIIFVLYYFTFRTVAETLMVLLGVPLSMVGGIWALSLLGYNMSIAVWVGLIALAGVGAETSALMLAYLDGACERRRAAGALRTLADLVDAVQQGALERIRPVTMTSLSNILGLMPVMAATGTGAEVMKRIAAPMVGGVFTAMLLTLVVIPAVYVMWRWRSEGKCGGAGAGLREQAEGAPVVETTAPVAP
jgi:Cu(I)/Ag(I) efflux system membrane protein CusA/SilA